MGSATFPTPPNDCLGERTELTDAERLALLASYIRPDGRLCVPGIVVIDPKGVERIVMGADERSARVELRVTPEWSPAGNSIIYLFAEDGDDGDVTPEVGFEIRAGGDAAVSLGVNLTTKKGVMGAGEPDLHFFPWYPSTGGVGTGVEAWPSPADTPFGTAIIAESCLAASSVIPNRELQSQTRRNA